MGHNAAFRFDFCSQRKARVGSACNLLNGKCVHVCGKGKVRENRWTEAGQPAS